MAVAEGTCDHNKTVLTIQPNSSLSWKMTKWVLLFFTLCLLSVAYYFYSLGAWLVMPFVGIELLVIGLGFYMQCCHAHQQQIIQIDDSTLSIRSDGKEGRETCFPKAWLKIIQTHDPQGWYPSRLFIGCHGKFVEIGKFLVESERKKLADNLRCAIQGA